MRARIPQTLGLLALAAAPFGCAPQQFADALEKVFQAECECADSQDVWNEEKNCKNACEGYAKAQKAQLEDNRNEPCDDIGDIAKDLKDCAKKGCGEDRDECVAQAYLDLNECWPGDDGPQGDAAQPDPRESELAQEDGELDQEELTSRLLFGGNLPENAVDVGVVD